MAVSSQIIATLAAASGGKIYATKDQGPQIGESGKNYLVISKTSSSVDYGFSLRPGPVPSNWYGYTIAIELAE